MKVSQILHLAVLFMVGAASLQAEDSRWRQLQAIGRGTVRPGSICGGPENLRDSSEGIGKVERRRICSDSRV